MRDAVVDIAQHIAVVAQRHIAPVIDIAGTLVVARTDAAAAAHRTAAVERRGTVEQHIVGTAAAAAEQHIAVGRSIAAVVVLHPNGGVA